MTTPAAPSRSIAIWSPVRRSTAFRARRANRASISAPPRQPVREEIPAGADSRPASRRSLLAGPRGAPDDLKKLTGVSGAIEKKFNDLGIFHYWQLAELDHDTAHKIGEEVGLPAAPMAGSPRPRR